MSKRYIFLAAALVFVSTTTLSYRYYNVSYNVASPPILGETMYSIPQRHYNVAVASLFEFHFDVYLSFVWALERVAQRNSSNASVQVYAPKDFNYKFQDIVDRFGLYHGTVLDSTHNLIADISRSEKAIDLLVLGTCEFDMRHWNHDLLEAWNARDSTNKFQIVCFVHDVEDTREKQFWVDWSHRNAIRVLSISEHVSDGIQTSFRHRADSTDPKLWSAGFEHISVDTFVPVLDLTNLPLPEPDQHRMLSKAVIQGFFFADRRDYSHIFSDLIQSLHEDPLSWGYLPLHAGQGSFLPDPSLANPPFTLALIGSGHIEIPAELAHIITIHTQLDYAAFYKLVSGMDICVPAFSGDIYYNQKASSTVAMAIEANVPILATRRIRAAYKYIDDDRVVVTRPAAMREIQALKALRTGDASSFLDSSNSTGAGANVRVRDAVRSMMQRGWTRERADWNEFKRGLWRRNENVVERLLRDL